MHREQREFPYTLYPVSPNVNNVYNHSAFVKAEKLVLAHFYQLNNRLYVDVSCPFIASNITLHLVCPLNEKQTEVGRMPRKRLQGKRSREARLSKAQDAALKFPEEERLTGPVILQVACS